ncbi:MAG: hypothetical protein SVE93_06285 [Candidatus Thermoplasmatota archaeon]|nr:hypothetical protein [Candidatus Thermoplasmatota archaeon]
MKRDLMSVIVGKEEYNKYNISREYELLYNAIEEPERFVFLLESIIKLDPKSEVRYALLRAQVHLTLNLSSDMEANQKKLYVAKVIEKLLFGRNLLEEGEQKS